MPTLEELEKGSNDNYAKAYHEIKAKNGELYFYTPENKVTTTGTCFKLDTVFKLHAPY